MGLHISQMGLLKTSVQNALLKRMEDFTLDIEITENFSVMRYLKSVLLSQRSLRIRKGTVLIIK